MKKYLPGLIAIARKYWVVAIILAVSGGGVWAYRSSTRSDVEFVTVQRGIVVKEVSVSGKVASAEELSLSFERSGKVVQVRKQVGDRVWAGETIAALSSGDLAAQLAQAEANVAVATARLDELKRGARPEELAIKQTALAEAKLALRNTYATIHTTLENAYISADEAVRQDADAFFTRDEDLNPALSFQTYDIQAQIDAENGRAAMTRELTAWKSEISNLDIESSESELDQELTRAATHLLNVQKFLKRLGDALVNQANLTPANVTAYQTSLTAARTRVAASIASITSAAQTISSQKLTVEQAGNNLKLAEAGTSAESLRAQEAEVASARAKVLDIETQIGKTVLRAPIAGIITKQDAKLGQTVTAQNPVVGLISDAKFEIEADVPEIEIGQISVGNPAVISIDAFPEESFRGKVTFIDPAETIKEGVVNFKIKVAFDEEDARIKSGFTANLEIRTVSRENVLILPNYAISDEGQGSFVRMLEGGEKVKVPVKIGVWGNGGNVEIVSGVGEGDQVLSGAGQASD